MENKFVFDREKLEKRIKELSHAIEPTKDFLLEEMERCKDPRYFFNNYWIVDGKAVDPISEEQWNNYINQQKYFRNGK